MSSDPRAETDCSHRRRVIVAASREVASQLVLGSLSLPEGIRVVATRELFDRDVVLVKLQGDTLPCCPEGAVYPLAELHCHPGKPTTVSIVGVLPEEYRS